MAEAKPHTDETCPKYPLEVFRLFFATRRLECQLALTATRIGRRPSPETGWMLGES
jgi:hypothetical protein